MLKSFDKTIAEIFFTINMQYQITVHRVSKRPFRLSS